MFIKCVPVIISVIIVSVTFTQIGEAQYLSTDEAEYITFQSSGIIGLNSFNIIEAPKLKSVASARGIAYFSTIGLIVIGAVIFDDISNRRAAAGFTIQATGLVLAPSAGSLYARDTGRFIRGSLLRVSGVGLAYLGAGPMNGSRYFSSSRSRNPAGLAVIYAGLGFFTYQLFHDMITGSKRSVEEYNESINSGQSLSVSPWISPGLNGMGFRLNFNL